MGLKIKFEGVKAKLYLKDLPNNIKKNFSRIAKDKLEGEIVDQIFSGKSPVRNHRFDPYSDSYSKIKGKKSPVDMFKDGKMLKSLSVKQNKIGQVIIKFSSIVARGHQDGANNLPVRKLLPEGLDKFNIKLTRDIVNMLKKAVKKAVIR